MTTAARNPQVWSKTQYFDIQKNWRKLGKLFRSDTARSIWHPCMEEFMEWRAEENKYPYKPQPEAKAPTDYESCDWRWNQDVSYNRQPKFWDYARHSACHWVADLALFVAKTAYPQEPWRILTARHHTTVWNGSTTAPVLFDINFHAMGVEPQEAIKLASKGRELKVGHYLKPYLHTSP